MSTNSRNARSPQRHATLLIVLAALGFVAAFAGGIALLRSPSTGGDDTVSALAAPAAAPAPSTSAVAAPAVVAPSEPPPPTPAPTPTPTPTRDPEWDGRLNDVGYLVAATAGHPDGVHLALDRVEVGGSGDVSNVNPLVRELVAAPELAVRGGPVVGAVPGDTIVGVDVLLAAVAAGGRPLVYLRYDDYGRVLHVTERP